MARRRQTRRRPEKPQRMAWEPGLAKLFGLAPEAYTPPDHVMVRGTLRGGTFVAVFHDEDGRAIRFRTRVGLDRATGQMWITDQAFTLTAVYRKDAASKPAQEPSSLDQGGVR